MWRLSSEGEISAPAGGCAPHSLFGSAKKRTLQRGFSCPCGAIHLPRRARWKRKSAGTRSGAVALRAVRGSAYRCLLRFGLAFGHARIFCQVDTAVPWRMVRRSSGCKNAFDQLLFSRVPLRYALPGPAWRPAVPALTNHRPAAAKIGAGSIPVPPRTKGFPKGRAFPSLTAARECQPSPAGDRRDAYMRPDPPKHFFFSTGRGAFSF